VSGSGSNATVTVLRKGKQVSVPVVAGITGDSSTAIISGLASGTTVVLPSVSIQSTSSGTASTGGTGGGAARTGRVGLGGGGFGGGGFPGG